MTSEEILMIMALCIIAIPLPMFFSEMKTHYSCYKQLGARLVPANCMISKRHLEEHFSIGVIAFMIYASSTVNMVLKGADMMSVGVSMLYAVMVYAVSIHFKDERLGRK